MSRMAERRQLLLEIDRTFKLIAEGLDIFDEKLEAIKAAPNKQHKEKHMSELKEELKKLQRYRAKVMSWSTCKEVKDKRAVFEEQRLIIETRMETYREMERADKTKPFSEKALEAEPKIDPVQREHEQVFQWLRQTINALQTQTEPWEAELEKLTAGNRGGRTISAKIEDLRLRISQNQQHVSKLELIMRYLHNDSLDFQEVKDLRDIVEAYIDSQRESRYAVDVDYLDIYDDLLASVRENDQLLLLPIASSQLSGVLTNAVSTDCVDEETHETNASYHPHQQNRDRDRSESAEPAAPSPISKEQKRTTAAVPPTYTIDDRPGPHYKISTPKLLLARQNVIPAPVPPPLSVPYSQVAAARLQQQLDADYIELYNGVFADQDRQDAATDRQLNGIFITSESSEHEAEQPNDQRLNTTSIQTTTLSQKVAITPTSVEKAAVHPSDGNQSSTEDLLALVCDQEKRNLVSPQLTTPDLSKNGDKAGKSSLRGRILPSSLCMENVAEAQTPDVTSDCVAQNQRTTPTAATSIGTPSSSTTKSAATSAPPLKLQQPPPPQPLRFPKLPYAFNGPVNGDGGGSDADGNFGSTEEMLKMLEAASERLPHLDSSMRSSHRRMWREQVTSQPSFPVHHNQDTLCGLDFNSRFYYTLLSDETLMFVFYYEQGTLAQRHAIECLEAKGWMWHVQRMRWFKHESADISALREQMESLDQNGFVVGTFKYFDYEKWEKRSAPADFVFHLKYWKNLLPWESSAYQHPTFL